jgi:hypothetical protein
LWVAEVLLEYADAITAEDGRKYKARACGDEMRGTWQGWIEFVPLGDGEPLRSARETTQPNRLDTVYWATGLTPIYLEGALRRARQPTARPVAPEPAPPLFDTPAEPFITKTGSTEAVLDPFSIYRKGEPLLRRQLSALAGWHLVNIIRRYDLSDDNPARLAAREPAQLVELIIAAVRASVEG